MSLAELWTEDPEAVRAECLDRLDALISLVKNWVEASGWRTRRVTKPVTEPGLGRHEVPLLLIERGEVGVALSPLARIDPRGDGVVDLYLMPAYDDVVSLHFEGGGWFISDAFPTDPTAPRLVIENERLSLNEGTMNRVLDAVAAHA